MMATFDHADYERGKRTHQINHDAALALSAFAAFIRMDEALSMPGNAADASLTTVRDAMRATADDDLRTHLQTLAEIATEDGNGIDVDLWAAADRIRALWDATDRAKAMRRRQASAGLVAALVDIARPELQRVPVEIADVEHLRAAE